MKRTKHANDRTQQRRIEPFIQELLYEYGAVTYRHGVEVYSFNSKSRKKLRSDLGENVVRHIAPLLNTYLVASGGTAITVAHRKERIRR